MEPRRRIILAWEMGRNLGHLSRLVPLASRLKARGHEVLAVIRDVESAAAILGPADVPFVPSPLHTGAAARDPGGAGSYADLLLSQGWNDPSALWGLVQAWIRLYQLFEPDVAVLDYAPTARLAARVSGVPCVWVGSGFTVPPTMQPLPPFPEWPGATVEHAERAERQVLATVKVVMSALRAPPLSALSELFSTDVRHITTFPELDPYGARSETLYVGPIVSDCQGRAVDWPDPSARRRVVAYIRPEMQNTPEIIEGLATCGATVMCYAPGIGNDLQRRPQNRQVRFTEHPLQLERLFADADACLSYSPAATVANSLRHAVPQILAPTHIEAYLTARRVEALGAGIVFRGPQTPASAAALLDQFFRNERFKARAAQFADRYRHHNPSTAADDVVRRIERVVAQGSTADWNTPVNRVGNATGSAP